MKLATVEEALAAKEKKLALLKRRTLGGGSGEGPEIIASLKSKLTVVESEVQARAPQIPIRALIHTAAHRRRHSPFAHPPTHSHAPLPPDPRRGSPLSSSRRAPPPLLRQAQRPSPKSQACGRRWRLRSAWRRSRRGGRRRCRRWRRASRRLSRTRTRSSSCCRSEQPRPALVLVPLLTGLPVSLSAQLYAAECARRQAVV